MMDIVFVHLNTLLPNYLEKNLIRTRCIFPDQNIVLISNTMQKSIPGITKCILSEPQESLDLRKILSHPVEFRKNFWHSSIARFAYLLAYQKQVNRRILHFESDVLISKDFPLSKILQIPTNKIAFPILAKERGVASVFYSGGAKTLKEFVSFSISHAMNNPLTTDMLVLREFYNNFPEFVKVLPAGPGNVEFYSNDINSDIFPKIIEGLSEFQGVFDGTDIGFYLFGTNPWNRRGVSVLHQEVADTYTIMSRFKFEYNGARNFVDVISDNEKIPIYNLHITSKRDSLFECKNLEVKVNKFLNVKSEKKQINITVFFIMLFKKIIRTLTKS